MNIQVSLGACKQHVLNMIKTKMRLLTGILVNTVNENKWRLCLIFYPCNETVNIKICLVLLQSLHFIVLGMLMYLVLNQGDYNRIYQSERKIIATYCLCSDVLSRCASKPNLQQHTVVQITPH